MDNKDQVKGKVKQAVGDLTDNEDLKKEGKADEKAGEPGARLQQGDKLVLIAYGPPEEGILPDPEPTSAAAELLPEMAGSVPS